MKDIVLLDMLQAGVHFGHQQSRRHPKMEPFIFTARGGVSILNLEKTKTALTQAATFVRDTVASGGSVLFVGTKRQAHHIVLQAAQSAGMPFVVDRWIGGLFTNFNHVRQLIHKLATLKEQRAAGQLSKYTKKEQLEFEREIERLDKLVGGLGAMDRLPAAVVVVDVKNEKTAVRESRLMHVPLVALCDSNVNPADIDYCIPANDDATKSIAYVLNILTEAIQEGRQQADIRLAESAKRAAEEAAALHPVESETPMADVAAEPIVSKE